LGWQGQVERASTADIQLNTESPEPICRQIVRQVRLGVALGRLSAGETLPSVRTLAQQLVINPNTVARAYAELERQGVVRTRHRVGTFVAGRPEGLAPDEKRLMLGDAVDAMLTEAVHLGLPLEGVVALVRERASRFHFPAKAPKEAQ